MSTVLCDTCKHAEVSVEFVNQTILRYWECPYHMDAGTDKKECEDYEKVSCRNFH